MKNQLLILSFFAFILVFSACVNKKKLQTQEGLTERIIHLEQLLTNTSQSAAKNDIMRELGDAYQQYAIENPNAGDTPDKLLKAAQNYGSLGDFVEATIILKSIIESYPKTNFAKNAMFAIAYIYGELAKYDKGQSEMYNNNSKKYYKMLIKEFPDDPLAKQSKLLMSFVGKSDEELFDELIEKSKQ